MIDYSRLLLSLSTWLFCGIIPFLDCFTIIDLFSCKDATQQILMSVCPSVCVFVVNWLFCQFQGFRRLHKVT